MTEPKRMINARDLTVQGRQFGLTFEEDGQVALWIEDDEMWYLVESFSEDWLGDLHKTVWGGLQEWAKRKVRGRRDA